MKQLKYKGYVGSVEYSEEDDMYFGELLNTDDLVLFEGRNYSELKNDFQNAVKEYITLLNG